jgi:hypothetical protein
MSEEVVLTTDLLLHICDTDGIPIGGAKVTGDWHYHPYYLNGTDERTDVCRVGTWYSPDTTDEVTVFALVTSSSTDDSSYVESWLVRWIEDMGDSGTSYTSYVLPYPALKRFFQRWLKEQRQR